MNRSLQPGAPQAALSCPAMKGQGSDSGGRRSRLDLKTLKRWMGLPKFIEEYRRSTLGRSRPAAAAHSPA